MTTETAISLQYRMTGLKTFNCLILHKLS